MRRKQPLVTGRMYHVMNKSIAGFKIFHKDSDYERMLQMMRFFSYRTLLPKFSQFLSRDGVKNQGFEEYFDQFITRQDQSVEIVAYCLMPTHIHLVMKQLRKNGISFFMSNLCNAYARYFNTRRKRKGPLWVGKFKNVDVTSDEQLLHLTRYVHLNPTTAQLTDNPLQWPHSSYHEYVKPEEAKHRLCRYDEFINLSPREYQKFTESNLDLQRELAVIKHLVLE